MSQQTSAPNAAAIYIDERELARRTTLSPRTLQLMRRNGVGAPWAKLGGRVVYKWADVERWIEERTQRPPTTPRENAASTQGDIA